MSMPVMPAWVEPKSEIILAQPRRDETRLSISGTLFSDRLDDLSYSGHNAGRQRCWSL